MWKLKVHDHTDILCEREACCLLLFTKPFNYFIAVLYLSFTVRCEVVVLGVFVNLFNFVIYISLLVMQWSIIELFCGTMHFKTGNNVFFSVCV